MLLIFASLLLQSIAAVQLPPPTGPYQVGCTQHVFNHTTNNDPVAPTNVSSVLLATIYYPTLTIPIPGINTAPYLDLTTAKIWGDVLQFPNNSLQTLTTWNVYKAQPLDQSAYGISQKPTVIFSPGGGENAVMYNALNSELASQGYTVLALDHPGETPYLQLPDGAPGIYGIDIMAVWNRTLQTSVYNMRISDTLAIIRHLFPFYVTEMNAPWNTTHFLAIGHSIGGAASAAALAIEPSLLGAVNLDGEFFDVVDVKKPFLMLAGGWHTPAIDPSWSPFSANQTGWWQWLNITGSSHQDFSDLGDWVDLQGLRNKTITPRLGGIWGPRMNYVVKEIVGSFFGFVDGEKEWEGVVGQSLTEVVVVNGSTCA